MTALADRPPETVDRSRRVDRALLRSVVQVADHRQRSASAVATIRARDALPELRRALLGTVRAASQR
jgi:hypothetical protein